MAISAGGMTKEGNYYYPTNWDHKTANSTFMDFCSTYQAELDSLSITPAPVLGQCQAFNCVLAGCVLAIVFTTMSIPPLERFGKYMCAWALLIWICSIIIFTGFVFSDARIPYIKTAINKTTGVDTRIPLDVAYSADKMWSCDTDGYCLSEDFKSTYQSMQAFAFMALLLLFGQGASTWNRRVDYIDMNAMEEKTNMDGTK